MKSLGEIIWANATPEQRIELTQGRLDATARLLEELDAVRAARGDETIGRGLESNILRRELRYLEEGWR